MLPTDGETILQFLRPSDPSKCMILILKELEGLTQFQQQTLINRYITLMEEYTQRSYFFAIIFHSTRTIVTVGSLMVPALLSIQNTSVASPEIGITVYWITWFLSLFVTISNGVLTLFKIDKKYYFIHSIFESLQSEMWQYIHLTGKYESHAIVSTHSNQYTAICDAMEKLKMKQVEEEYYKVTDSVKKAIMNTKIDTTPLLQGNTVDEEESVNATSARSTSLQN